MASSFSITHLINLYAILFGLLSIGAIIFGFYISKRQRRPFTTWFLVGCIYNIFSISFIFSMFPLSWGGPYFFQLIGFTLFLLINAAVAGLAFLIIPLAQKRFTSWVPQLTFVTLGFFCSDILRSFFLSLLNYGKGSTLGEHLLLGSLGQPLIYTPLVTLTFLGGLPLLTGLLGAYGFSLYMEKWRTFLSLVLISCALVIFIRVFPYEKVFASSLSILLVTTNNPEVSESTSALTLAQGAKNISALLETNSLAAIPQSDILLLPESTYLTEILAAIGSSSPSVAHFIFDGSSRLYGSEKTTISLIYDAKEDVTYFSEKEFLMPVSEYIPYFLTPFLRLSLGKEGFEKYKAERSYRPGEVRFAPEINGGRVATLICSEATSASALRRISRLSPSLLLLQSNLSVYKGSLLSYYEVLGYSRLAAATLGKPLVSSNNASYSFVISRFGDTAITLPPKLSATVITVNEDGSLH